MSVTDQTPEPGPKKKSFLRKRFVKLPVWLWGIIAVFVLLIAIGSSGNSEETASVGGTQTQQESAEQDVDAAVAATAKPKRLSEDQSQKIIDWNSQVADELGQFGSGMEKCQNLSDLGGDIQSIADCGAEAYDGFETPAYLLIDELQASADSLAPSPCRRSLLKYRSQIAGMSGTMKLAVDALQQYDLDSFSAAVELYVLSTKGLGKVVTRLVSVCV